MLDPKYIPLFLGGFIVWMAFVICVGFFGSRGKREGEKFLTGGSDMSLFLIFCTLGATIIGTGSSIGAIGDGFNHGWGGAIFGLGSALGLLILFVDWLWRRLRQQRKKGDRAVFPAPQVNMNYDYDAAADARVRALHQRLDRLEERKRSGLIDSAEYEELRNKYLNQKTERE